MWQHKKYKSKFKGSYTYHRGERVFELNNGRKRYTFESWQMAKKLGWIKL